MAGALLVAMAAMVPWSPDPITTIGQDDPNTILQHALFGSHWIYGRDIHFTHGPWAIWYFRHYWPTSYPPFILSHVAISTILAVAVVGIALNATNVRTVQIAVLVLSLAVFTVDFDARLYFLIALVPLTFDERATGRSAFLSPALASICAFGGLVKVSALLVGLAAIGSLAIYEFLVLRRVSRVGLAYLAGLVGFDLIAAQNPLHLVAYLKSALEVGRGYAEAVGYSKEPYRYITPGALVFVGVAMLFGVLVISAEWRRRGVSGLFFALSYAFVFYGVFKGGFVVDNFQHLQHVSALVPIVGCYLAVNWARIPGKIVWSRGGPRVAATAAWAALVLIPLAVLPFALRDPGLYEAKIAKLEDNVRAGLNVLAGNPTILSLRHEAAMASIRESHPIPPVVDSTLLMSPLQSAGLAHGLDLYPLPAINLYQHWSRYLIEEAARLLSSADGPRRVFADKVSRVDRAYWLTLIENYRVVEEFPHFIHFERAPPSRFARGPVRRVETSFGQAIDISEGGLIWVEATISPNAIGRILELVFKKPQIFWRLELADGTVQEIRCGTILAEAGFLLSPGSATIRDLIDAPGGENTRASRAVRRVTILADGNSGWLYEPAIAIAFTPLQAPLRR